MVATIGLTINECNVSDRRYEGFYFVIRHWTRHFLFSSTGGGLDVIESNWAAVPDGDIFFSVRPGADWASLNRIGRPFRTARFIDSSGSSSGLRLWGGSMIFIDG